MKILDIGCGKYKTPGAIGIDQVKLDDVDVVHNLEKFPYPLKADTFDEVICNHVLEHVTDVIAVMQEIYRISKAGAVVKIRVPHGSCSKALWNDPTHVRGFTSRTFRDYFSKDALFGYYSDVDFSVQKVQLNYCLYDGKRGTPIPRFLQLIWNSLANINRATQEIWERFLAGYIGGFEEIYVELVVQK